MAEGISRIHHPWVGRLGRLYVPDDRDRLYPLRSITAPLPPRAAPWGIGPILDQGQTPQCVAYTTRAWLNAEPIADPDREHPGTQQIYDGAQARDGMPLPHDGSTDRGAMAYMQSIGMVDSYHWAANLADMIAYVTTTGPLLCGTNWHQGQFSPDPSGFIKPLGPVEGGHEYLCYWYSTAENAFWFENSWGTGWGSVPGAPGTFKMLAGDFGTLLAEGGDACAAQLVIKPVVPPPPPPPVPPRPPHKRRRWHWF